MRKLSLKFGFRAKIYIGIISIVLLTGVLIAVFVSHIVKNALAREYRNRGVSLSVNLATRSEDAILAEDFLRLNNLVHEVKHSADDILYAFILDNDGEVLSHTFGGGFPIQLKTANSYHGKERSIAKLLKIGKDLIYDFATPVFAEDLKVGTVRLGLKRTKVTETIKEVLLAIFIFLGLSIFIADLVGVILANHFTKRVNRLRLASQEVLRGNLDVYAGSGLKKNCWDITGCGHTDCPAYHNVHLRCWHLMREDAGEAGNGGVGDEIALEKCLDCPVYIKNSGDELQQLAESFDAMTLSLKSTIGQLARSRDTLRQSEEKYRRVFEASMDLIFVADPAGLLMDINPAGALMLGAGFPADLIQSAHCADFIVTPDINTLFGEIDANGFVKDRECVLKTKAGEWRHVLLSSTAHKDGDGCLVGYEGIVKDITHRKNMELQLIQADKLASIGQLASGVAHEINNPMGLILGYTQLMIRGESSGAEQIEDLKTIEKHARNCRRIVQALLNFARKTETRRTCIRINEIIKSVVAVVQHQFKLDNILMSTAFADGIPDIRGDGEKLKQVFMNLLMNARQSIAGEGQITIATSYDPDCKTVFVGIEDTGSGIDPRIIGKIFDPFFTTKPTGQGTGLGLSVSYGIVKEHNGEISVQSEPGWGAVFTVALPAGPDGVAPRKGMNP